MRLHGELVIKRTCKQKKVKNYSEYVEDLRKDFHHRCGYCSKPERLTSKGFEIDHFVPRKAAPEKVNDYTNLVYSCFTCNRKKGAKVPSEICGSSNTIKTNIIDPVSAEFDKHIGRNESGNIEYYTDIGRNMSESVFKFQYRPIRLLWKLDMLFKKKKKLSEKIISQDYCNSKEGIALAKICCEIDKLSEYIFDMKE